MSYFEKKCSNCGATIIEGDTFCRTCKTDIEREPESKENLIEGIKVSDWHTFIDKNSSRYVEIFSKNEGKKLFLNMNWAAMFFNFYWMFYRKMYKYAFIFLIISLIFSISTIFVVVTAYKPAINEVNKIIEPYSEFLDEGNGIFSAHSDGSVDVSEILEAATEYDKKMDKILIKLSFSIIVPSLVFGAIFGLFADCIYRRYILRNINYKVGGTSGWSLAGGVVIYLLITRLIESPIVSYLTAKLLE